MVISAPSFAFPSGELADGLNLSLTSIFGVRCVDVGRLFVHIISIACIYIALA